jgi:hypothetical protein
VGIGIVLVLLAGAAGLVALPFGAALVRVHGLSVVWWYGAVLGPGLAVLVAVAALHRRSPPASASVSAPQA